MLELLRRITINPRQCGGRPCIRGMRIRVSDVLDLFVAGLSAEEIFQCPVERDSTAILPRALEMLATGESLVEISGN